MHTHTHTHTHTHRPTPPACLRMKHILRSKNCVAVCYIPLIHWQSSLLLLLSLSLCVTFCVCLSLSPPSSLPLSLYLSGAAMTCLGFDVSVCIVTEAMLPPTSVS